jgi:hypothetical protein
VENLDGLRLPKRIVIALDRWPQYEIGVMKNTFDSDLSDLAASAATRNAPPAVAPPVNIQVVQVTAGCGCWRSETTG